MVYLGVALLALGGLLELRNYLVGAWPTSLTWVLMSCGLLLVAVGLSRGQSHWRHVVVAAVTLLVLAVAGAWLLG